jgi:hypothetical protein
MTKPRTKPGKTIEGVLEEFLDEQEARLSPGTFGKYESIVHLLKAYCERYWPEHDGEYERITKAGGTYCGTYGPEDIPEAFSMFLGYFMPHKVIAGEETTKAARTVIRKLAKWLMTKGYAPDADYAVE